MGDELSTQLLNAVVQSMPPIRETPAPYAIHPLTEEPSHPPVENEMVLEVDDIQGNILGGFSKDYQTFLFFEINNPGEFRKWLKDFVPFVATSAEVIAFNRLFKAIRRRQGERTDRPPTVKATWRNIAFTYMGFQKLRDDEIPDLLDQDFVDAAFREGLADRAEILGDPVGTDEQGKPLHRDGHPRNWVVGGTEVPVHLLIQVASDSPRDLNREVRWILKEIRGVKKLWEQRGENLPDILAGHEHFGFLDGVSQPGIRGRISEDPNDVLTPRQNPDERDKQGKPGQDLLWPGEFVFGYPRQRADAADIREQGPDSHAGPEWGRNGSFLVFRRLKQDVYAFHRFLNAKAPGLRLTPPQLGAKLVGRWSSGAPVLRAPETDDPKLGATDCANNHFEFQGASAPIPAGPSGGFDCSDSVFKPSPGDQNGLRCPFAGHIRKVYPRDDVPRSDGVCDNPLPAAEAPEGESVSSPPNEADTQTHRLLRRGIPFGRASRSTPENPKPGAPRQGRGLLFFAYQTSIVNQFEYVTQACNNPDFKDAGSGHDFIIGQNSTSPDRKRKMKIKVGEGTGDCRDLETNEEWVIPTGGGYFFAPSIEALRDTLAEQEQTS